MKIKSAKSFRQWYKNLTPARQQASQFWDENFIGAQHEDYSGFFTMYHGDKVHVYDFLRKEVEMAEDGQAIYEFVQNAADSDSTQFYMFYDENYLMVINNGSVFSKEGIKSILNIGQSFGKQDPDKIGRYGIGFKLVHRLVGKSSGLNELLNVDNQGYRGPILFSWSDKLQFDNFLNADDFEYVDFNDNNAPWLLKILITNFPAQPTEKVKDLDYSEIEPFQNEELKSFQSFLKTCNDKIDLKSSNSGSIFFLKLGDNKFEYLQKQQQEYLNGLSTSMHFLKSLDTLVINENLVNKDKEATNVLEFTVKNGSDNFNEIGLTEVRDKESDAKFKICFADNANSANEIKKHPNIYKYFPAVKEVNKLSFVIHSNLFELSSNRQNLTETPINKNLLKLLSKQLIAKMEVYKSTNRDTFKNLFTSILMSEETSSNSSGNGWQNEFFYNNLLKYICEAIPTKNNNYSDKSLNVKINKLNLNLDLANFGLSHIQWFEWDNEADQLLIDEATKSEKLGIKEWDIRDIIENADLDSINSWITDCDEENYKAFLDELEESYLRIETKERIRHIKLFKFSNGKFYSLNEVIKKDNNRRPVFKFTNCFFSNSKTKGVKNELTKLGLVISELSVNDYPTIFSTITLPDDRKHYDLIAKWSIENGNKLLAGEKKKLFLNFINEATKFDNVAEGTLKDLHLFCDSNSEIKPLNKLIDCNINTASWLKAYKIKRDEFFTELKPYLISKQEEIFEEIFIPNQDIILSELTEANEIKSLIKLYQDNQKQFFKQYIIKKTEHSFSIARKTSSTYQVQSADLEARKFINENCATNLFVLPHEFLNYKEDDGIVKADDLHSLILDFVDVDEYKETLVDIVKYKAKYKFLLKLSEFRFNSETRYLKEDFEYKILDLACNELKESDFPKFRNSVVIETSDPIFKLSDISLFSDKIKISNKEFSLSKILPSTHQNSNLISDLITLFVKQGIPSDKLNALFGINEELDINEIFKKFSEQSETIENTEQFFFLIYYHKHVENVDLSKLGFDLNSAVYPSNFALETEKLPKYIQEWINQNEINISNLESIGVYTENSTLVSLRKFFLSNSDFNQNTIAQDEKLSDGKMLFNTFEWLKEKEIKITSENGFIVFKEMVRVINSVRAKNQDLRFQDEYNFALLEGNAILWEETDSHSIFLYQGYMPKTVGLDEIKDYIFYLHNNDDFAVNGNSIYINENTDIEKTLQKVASDDSNDFSFEELWKLFKENNEDTNEENQDETTSFLDEVNQFIDEQLEGSEWSDYIPELKNLLQDFNNQPREKQKLFNLIAKIKLTKEKNIKYEDSDEGFNIVKIGNEKFFVHSARGAFAYIHPIEILKMKNEEYKMALDFSTKSRIKIYHTAEEILQLNTNHILTYQYDKPLDELFSFCEANRGENKHLLIIDKENANEKSKAYLKLFNNSEDDYQ